MMSECKRCLRIFGTNSAPFGYCSTECSINNTVDSLNDTLLMQDSTISKLQEQNAALVKRWAETKQQFIKSFVGIGAAYLKAKKDGDESLCFTWQSVFINMQVLSYRVGKDQEFPHGDDMEIQKDMIERSREDFPASWIEHERQVKELQAGSK